MATIFRASITTRRWRQDPQGIAARSQDAVQRTPLQLLAYYVPPLDIVSGAMAAYSTRRLRTAYTGAAIRIRRSTDNAEQDIGFTAAGDINMSAFGTFVGAGNAFLKTFYDQSGNGLDATQATAGNQPPIAPINGKLRVNFPGVFGHVLATANDARIYPGLTVSEVIAARQTFTSLEIGAGTSDALFTVGWFAGYNEGKPFTAVEVGNQPQNVNLIASTTTQAPQGNLGVYTIRLFGA